MTIPDRQKLLWLIILPDARLSSSLQIFSKEDVFLANASASISNFNNRCQSHRKQVNR